MTGVEIINTYEKIDMFSIISLVILIALVGLAIIYIFSKCKNFSTMFAPDVLFIVFVFLVCVVGLWYALAHPSTIHEAKIDKTASYLELTDKYEVIENRGSVYVLKEKLY